MTCGVSVWRVAQFEPGQRAEQIKMAMSKEWTKNLDSFESWVMGGNKIIMSYEDCAGKPKMTVVLNRVHKYRMPERPRQETHPNPQVRRMDLVGKSVECAASYQRWRWSKGWLDCSGDWLIGSKASCTVKYADKRLNDFWELSYWDYSGYVMFQDIPVFFKPNEGCFVPLISKIACEEEVREFNSSRSSRQLNLFMCKKIKKRIDQLGEPIGWMPDLWRHNVASLKDMPNPEMYPEGELLEVENPAAMGLPQMMERGIPEDVVDPFGLEM